jgi:hypothetical protein
MQSEQDIYRRLQPTESQECSSIVNCIVLSGPSHLAKYGVPATPLTFSRAGYLE